MDLSTLTYVVVGATFLLYIGIAIWARAGSTGEFYVAGKGVHRSAAYSSETATASSSLSHRITSP